MTTTNTNQRPRQVANIYDLPLLLKVPGYKLQITNDDEVQIVRGIAFYSHRLEVYLEHETAWGVSFNREYVTLTVEQNHPSTLVFEIFTTTGCLIATWYFCLVPDGSNHPDILQAIKQAKEED